MNNMSSIMIVDDDDFLRDRLARAFSKRGYATFSASCFDEAVAIVAEQKPDLAVVDLKMPGKNGLLLVKEALGLDPNLRIVVLTGYGSIATATEAIRLGAQAYLAKPADTNDILKAFVDDSEAGVKMGVDDLEPPTLARMEWEHIQRVVHECDGNISIAARKLGVHRRTLQRKLNKWAPK